MDAAERAILGKALLVDDLIADDKAKIKDIKGGPVAAADQARVDARLMAEKLLASMKGIRGQISASAAAEKINRGLEQAKADLGTLKQVTAKPYMNAVSGSSEKRWENIRNLVNGFQKQSFQN